MSTSKCRLNIFSRSIGSFKMLSQRLGLCLAWINGIRCKPDVGPFTEKNIKREYDKMGI